MTSVATSLSRALPKPKYTGEHEEIPIHAQARGPRIVGAGALDETQVVLKVSISHLPSTRKQLLISYRDPAHHRTESEQDGAPDRSRTMPMEEPSPKFQSHNIH